MSPDVPSVDIWGLLFESPRRYPDHHVLFSSPATHAHATWLDVKSRAERFGRALRAHWAWQKGDVLLVMAPNCVQTPSVIWGCHWAGGVVAPANPGLSTQELQYYLTSSGAKGLVVHPQCLQTARDAVRTARLPEDRVLTWGDDAPQAIPTLDSWMGDAVVDQERGARASIDPAQDLAFLVYSSGTTGRPKGVMISHRNVVAVAFLQGLVESPHLHSEHDRILAVLPTYHIYGLICLLHLPVLLGITTVMMERFDIESFCRLVEQESISHAYVAPPVVLHLAKSRVVDRFDLSSLRMLTSGGAPLGAALIQDTYKRLGIPIRQAYGLSETTSVSHLQRWDKWHTAVGSSGPALPGVEAKMVRDNGEAASTNEEGELWIRGPSVFNGYLGSTDLTAASLTPDKWYKTGDIGYEDPSGNLYITDRAKDMIKFKGYQIAPTELEDILVDHPAVQDAAVIGIANEALHTEVPLAYIVLQDAANENMDTALEVLRYLRDRVASYKQLRGGIVWISQIPKGGSGKILKRELRDRAGGVDKHRLLGAVDYSHYRESKI